MFKKKKKVDVLDLISILFSEKCWEAFFKNFTIKLCWGYPGLRDDILKVGAILVVTVWSSWRCVHDGGTLATTVLSLQVS